MRLTINLPATIHFQSLVLTFYHLLNSSPHRPLDRLTLVGPTKIVGRLVHRPFAPWMTRLLLYLVPPGPNDSPRVRPVCHYSFLWNMDVIITPKVTVPFTTPRRHHDISRFTAGHFWISAGGENFDFWIKMSRVHDAETMPELYTPLSFRFMKNLLQARNCMDYTRVFPCVLSTPLIDSYYKYVRPIFRDCFHYV